jgi:tetratricopeptide (TPR) repeat protein
LWTLLLPFHAPAWAQTRGLYLTEDLQIQIGDAFFSQGDYYRAITEYKKLAILFPNSNRLPESLYKIGISYYRGDDFESAAASFAKVRKTYAASHFSRAAFYEGLSYRNLERYDDAALAFERARLFDEQDPAAADAQLGLSLNALDQDDYSGCRTELNAFLVNYPVDERVQAVRESLKLLDEYEGIPLKSPVLAGTLSAILPGSGQVYSGRKKDGAVAFVVNALFITGTIVALDNENYAIAAIAGGVGLPFYIGNIYGAANSAKKWNLSLARELSDNMSITLSFFY